MPIIHSEGGVPRSRHRVIIYDESFTSNVISGGSDAITITPPDGYVWEITSIYLKAGAPSGAASGTHQWMIRNNTATVIRGVSVFGSEILWDASMWTTADSYQRPSSEIASLYALVNATFDINNPIQVFYNNETNVGTSSTRYVRIVIEETPII